MSSRAVAPTSRAAVFAAVCVGLSTGAHAVMSRAAVPGPAVAFGLAIVFVFARIAAVRERGLLAITALVGGSQIGLHLLFQAAQSGAAVHEDAMAGMAGMPGMPGMTGASMDQASMGHLTPGMLCGHALAALVTAWWLRRGEAAVYECVRRASASLGVWLRLLGQGLPGPSVACPSSAISGVGREAAQPAAFRLIRFEVARRGPPMVAMK